MWRLQDMLAIPRVYQWFQRLIAKNDRGYYVRNYIRPRPGDRILDIGCGPGDILAFLPNTEYTGIDLSAQYIGAARKRFRARGTFICEDVANVVIQSPGTFDVVLANGFFHHLDDALATRLLKLAALALTPTGRLVAIEPCFVPEQSYLARWMLRRDRGDFVRDLNAYLALAKSVFPEVVHVVRHDLMRIPYTHLILTCSKGNTRQLPANKAA
jgi:SAM-dependent methyltransferase